MKSKHSSIIINKSDAELSSSLASAFAFWNSNTFCRRAWTKNKSTHSEGVRNAARRSKWGQTTTSQQSWGLCLKIGFASYVYLFWARVKEKSHTHRKKKYISQLFSQINIKIPSFVPIFKAVQLVFKFTLLSLHTMVSFITKVQKHLYIFFQKPPTFLRLCWAFV